MSTVCVHVYNSWCTNLHSAVTLIGEPRTLALYISVFPLKQMHHRVPASYTVVIAIVGSDSTDYCHQHTPHTSHFAVRYVHNWKI